MQIIIGSSDPSFNSIELEVKEEYFEKEYYDINDKNLPEKLYYYARIVIGGRWKEAEPHIMKNPEWAWRYAFCIIGGRWKEAEPHIMRNPIWAYWYARYIIKGRWPEAEPHIMKDECYSNMYRLIKCEL